MAFKILFLDIDGTILRPDNTIEHSTKEAIAQVQKIGIETVLATGRPVHEIREIGRKLNINSYIGYNGALAIFNNEELFAEPMEAHHVQSFLDVAKKYNHDIVLYTNNKNYFTSLNSPEVKRFNETFHLRRNSLFTDDVIDDILGMTLLTKAENGKGVYSLDDGIFFSQVNIEGMHHCYDVIREKVNKGVGVRFLLNRLGIPKESAIAFGDGMNDKEMLQEVGEGFAMGNANPNLFSYAKHKTTTVTNSGIYNGLKKLGLVK
ncbi:HAD family hydrolase [Bacillus sp. B15-48]|uniref:HAD family hydrolase n=1 Tax=Bacillus sp. B15-48 TaxID=1548601 RepID=UPI00193EDD81|nr:HAD family hydrolase [Bacillus sp. B15-48]MBM4763410.1 Cof-type HAD-IIB family hydrolase [Bacillus sp. B15-48]